ncbi:hypothetical protein V8B55DRAFT_1410577 [Mucor lusitanicus]|uniref:Uncharacterized protein n=2 Tax=Mucor circinelloides f. lusitanicus TaxID=29924 RepID=A0A162Q5M3_MUCCL|nr:hypothetical protein FB192DRAFT_1466180 [Mucor lusitanicus]OAC99199.1 hypothetical protein MUCCIDRAFT_84144 [Mucor lusitanicus CBS 277.49]
MAPTKEMEKQQGKIREVTESEDEAPVKSKKSSQKKEKTKKPKKKKSSKSKGLGLIKNDPLETLNGLGDGVIGGGQQQQQGGGGGGKDGQQPLSLRLDLNLEVEITLKARVHGDVTLALLA